MMMVLRPSDERAGYEQTARQWQHWNSPDKIPRKFKASQASIRACTWLADNVQAVSARPGFKGRYHPHLIVDNTKAA
jgi:hypothetical protein